MHIVEFTAGSLRFLDAVPAAAPADGFVWIYLDHAECPQHLPELQAAAQRLGGSALLDVHVKDLMSEAHPSHYDATSVYDRVIFYINPAYLDREAPLTGMFERAEKARYARPKRCLTNSRAYWGFCSTRRKKARRRKPSTCSISARRRGSRRIFGRRTRCATG